MSTVELERSLECCEGELEESDGKRYSLSGLSTLAALSNIVDDEFDDTDDEEEGRVSATGCSSFIGSSMIGAVASFLPAERGDSLSRRWSRPSE
jgi:hypothetical protein